MKAPEIDDDIARLARECMKEANGDNILAAELLYRRLDEDQKAKVLDAYLDRALRALINRVADVHPSKNPRTAIRGPENDEPSQTVDRPVEPGAGLVRLAHRNLDAVLETFKLSTGTKLGDATRVQLLEEATAEHGAARIHMERSMFLKEVAGKVGSVSRVRQVLGNNEIKQIATRVNAEVWS